MANLVNKSKTKIALVSILVLFVLSILSIIVFKLNLGVEFMDATVISMKLDHEELMSNIEPKAENYHAVSKIEKEGTNSFSIYLQGISKEATDNMMINLKNDISGVVSIKSYEYFTARERALTARAEILVGFGILCLSIYIFANIKNKKFNRAQAIALWGTQMGVILVNVVILLGLVSFLGVINTTMDTNFWSIFLLCLGIFIVYRIYEMLKERMILKTLEVQDMEDVSQKVVKLYWPEFVFISCFIALVTILPLVVLSTNILKSSILVLFTIVLSLVSVIYLKPYIQEQFLSVFESGIFKKNGFFTKKW